MSPTTARAIAPQSTTDEVCRIEWMHVDTDCLVALKPGGMLSVPGRGAERQDCLLTRAQAVHADARVVHRLDMATSGLMLFARGAVAQRVLSAAFAARSVQKRYEALVLGELETAEGTIDLPLIADWPNRPRQRVDPVLGKPSLTRFRVIGFEPTLAATRLALEPVTGRGHQLRVHLMAIGHPIVGDALYAPPESSAAVPRMMLHATRLRFDHPVSGRPVEVASPAPF